MSIFSINITFQLSQSSRSSQSSQTPKKEPKISSSTRNISFHISSPIPALSPSFISPKTQTHLLLSNFSKVLFSPLSHLHLPPPFSSPSPPILRLHLPPPPCSSSTSHLPFKPPTPPNTRGNPRGWGWGWGGNNPHQKKKKRREKRNWNPKLTKEVNTCMFMFIMSIFKLQT